MVGILKELDCYHGTDRGSYLKIKKNGFEFSFRNNHWLGNGIYFFLDDIDKAKWWAEQAYYIKEPVVLNIIISLLGEELFDIDMEKNLKELDGFAMDFKNCLIQNKVQIKEENQKDPTHSWQCFILDSFMKSHKPYKAVARTFITSKKIGMSEFQDVAKQLCVYSKDVIDLSKLIMIEN